MAEYFTIIYGEKPVDVELLHIGFYKTDKVFLFFDKPNIWNTIETIIKLKIKENSNFFRNVSEDNLLSIAKSNFDKCKIIRCMLSDAEYRMLSNSQYGKPTNEKKQLLINSDRVSNPENSRKPKNHLLTCKDRHTYRLIGKRWICQCSKELLV